MSRKKMIDEEKKERITLNINEELLNRIDKLIDEKGENRSKFIENLLKVYITDREKLK